MGTKKISKNRDVIGEYRKSVDGVWSKFFMKQGWVDEKGCPKEYETVVGDDNSFIVFADLFIKIDDAILDLEMNCAAGVFEEYYFYSLEHALNGYKSINYISYIKGFRHKKRTKFQEFKYNAIEKTKSVWFYIKHYSKIKEMSKDFMKRLEENECK